MLKRWFFYAGGLHIGFFTPNQYNMTFCQGLLACCAVLQYIKASFTLGPFSYLDNFKDRCQNSISSSLKIKPFKKN